MRVYPIAHGKNNNLYCAAKKFGHKFKLVMFFENEKAYVIHHRRTDPTINVDPETVYKELEKGVRDMDFQLVTPKEKFMKRMSDSELKRIKKENA